MTTTTAQQNGERKEKGEKLNRCNLLLLEQMIAFKIPFLYYYKGKNIFLRRAYDDAHLYKHGILLQLISIKHMLAFLTAVMGYHSMFLL